MTNDQLQVRGGFHADPELCFRGQQPMSVWHGARGILVRGCRIFFPNTWTDNRVVKSARFAVVVLHRTESQNRRALAEALRQIDRGEAVSPGLEINGCGWHIDEDRTIRKNVWVLLHAPSAGLPPYIVLGRFWKIAPSVRGGFKMVQQDSLVDDLELLKQGEAKARRALTMQPMPLLPMAPDLLEQAELLDAAATRLRRKRMREDEHRF